MFDHRFAIGMVDFHPFRVFRCDRIRSVSRSGQEPLDLRHIDLDNKGWQKAVSDDDDAESVRVRVKLTPAGVEACEAVPWPSSWLSLREDGAGVRSGMLEGTIRRGDIPFFARFFTGLGDDAAVIEPPELRQAIRQRLSALLDKYGGT